MIPLSIKFKILITPAFLIFIWGLPTFHWIANNNTFFNNCSLKGAKDYFNSDTEIIYSTRTRVSIRT